MPLIDRLPTLDLLLDRYADVIGPDRPAYGNHCYRMINFTVALAGRDDAETLEKLSIAGAFHDIGVWTHRTLDYLDISERAATAYLAETGKADWTAEIGAMVLQHHKITAAPESPLVDAFRKGDWVDVLHGLVTCGLPKALLTEAFAKFPDAGFHMKLLKVSGMRLLTHPWSPVPILRW